MWLGGDFWKKKIKKFDKKKIRNLKKRFFLSKSTKNIQKYWIENFSKVFLFDFQVKNENKERKERKVEKKIHDKRNLWSQFFVKCQWTLNVRKRRRVNETKRERMREWEREKNTFSHVARW